jgi:hypothetical protein
VPVRKAGKISGTAILGLLVAGPALADRPGCDKVDMPAAVLKDLHKAAKRELADPLDSATLFYCRDPYVGHATADTIPVPQSDGSELVSSLRCSGAADSARGWGCQVDRYRAIRVVPGAGRPEVRVEVGERASPEVTRDYAVRAFALLNEAQRVQACSGAAGQGQTTESLLARLAGSFGRYRLVISREGYALLRGGIQVRIRSANDFNPRDQIQCAEEVAVEE